MSSGSKPTKRMQTRKSSPRDSTSQSLPVDIPGGKLCRGVGRRSAGTWERGWVMRDRWRTCP
jgi:hypothetical protein